ncbi:MAG: cytochrome c oxidase subunit 3 [Bacteroidia bacterium]|nr:cytochrome c oxidase subunit 3 [Bacteroidia bacterium]
MAALMSSTFRARPHPKELMMWLYLATTGMLFAGFTSAYLVQRFHEFWRAFAIPPIFWANTVVLLFSSYAYVRARRGFMLGNYRQLQIGLMAALGFGVVFLFGQVIGWQMLVREGLFLSGNQKSVSYFYVLSGLHAFHLVVGLVVLGYWTFRALRYRVRAEHALGLKLTGLFWHGLDVLWVYLIVFLQVNQLF